MAAAPLGGTRTLPAHLIELPGGWTAWRCVALRGAGFASSGVLELSTPECGRAADRLIEAGKEVRRSRRAALDALYAELKRANEADAPLIKKAIRRLDKKKLPATPGPAAGAAAAIEEFGSAVAVAASGAVEFRHAFDYTVRRTSKKIRELSCLPRFREAVIWQNRHAYLNGVLPLAQNRPAQARDWKQRQREELLATYLQRYCVKNDTIGFFGPVGWASFVEADEPLVARPGAAFVENRTVSFEGWAADTLAEVLAKNKALRPWGVPRLMPFIHLDGAVVRVPLRPPTPVPAQPAAVLAACDGERSASEIADDLLRNPSLGFKSKTEVYRLLELFRGKGIIAWTIEVPVVKNPERELRRMMEKVEDEGLRRRVLAIFDMLEAARLGVERAAGDAEALDRAFQHLDETFTRLTGAAATRVGGEGKAYAARTLVYEDCRRDIEVEVGTELRKSIGEPLSLLLTSARWLTWQAAADYRERFQEVYAGLVRKTGSPTVELINFWYGIFPILFEGSKSPLDAIQQEFQRRWAEVLALPDAATRAVHYTCEELRPRVEAAFAAPRPGWVAARYHSPDVMVAAADTEAVGRGDYLLVMGELHTGINTLRGSLFPAQHPRPQDFETFFDLDLPEARVVPVTPKSWPELTARTLPIMINPRDRLLMVTHDSFGAPKSQAFNIGSLVVEETSEGLTVRTRDGQQRFDVIEVCADILSTLVVDLFRPLTPRPHTPRVTLDRLVVAREAWRFTAAEAAFAFKRDEAERYLAARRFMRARGMPRFIFYKAPVEPKPCYVDFDSPIYVDMFARALRRTAESGAPGATVTASEMLPGPGQSWLRDAEGNTYTSELRIVAVDQAGGRN
ncbi:MAG: lantibiotic dehydratase [Acidobacteria bacterium]|nr:lantibiotic dehydratase [Acidobacteriota bacterium]